jgi:hypothetical protein
VQEGLAVESNFDFELKLVPYRRYLALAVNKAITVYTDAANIPQAKHLWLQFLRDARSDDVALDFFSPRRGNGFFVNDFSKHRSVLAAVGIG